MLRELRGDPDRYTPPHLSGGFFKSSTRTSPTSPTSPTFYKDAKTSYVQYDESNCENFRKFENQCLDPGLRQDVRLRAGPSPEFSWSSTSSSSPGSGAQSYERFTTLTSTSRLAVCDQQDADLFSAYKQRLLLRDLHQLTLSPTSTLSSSPQIFDDAIHAEIDKCQLWDFVDCVHELVDISHKVYELFEGNLHLGKHALKHLDDDLEFYFKSTVDISNSIADQAWEATHLAGNNLLESPSTKEVNRAHCKRYNEVQLLYAEVKFKLNAIIADFTMENKYTPPHLRPTRRTLCFDSLTVQAVYQEEEVGASSAAASPEARATGHAPALPDAPPAAATVPSDGGGGGGERRGRLA